MACGLTGYVIQAGLYRLQTYIVEMAYEYISKSDDPFKSTTSIGEVGALKPSSRIALRIAPGPHTRLPMLLRQASYSAYEHATWYATHAGFDEVVPEGPPGSWTIAPPSRAAETIQVAVYLPKGRNLLKLPGGAFRLDHLNVLRIEKNSLGALRSENDSGLAYFQVSYDPAQAFNRLPEDMDLRLPAAEARVMETIAAELKLKSQTVPDAIATVYTYFQQGFHYSLKLERPGSNEGALADFLLHSRTGHCEYFATATVLLLRAAGIPARYVTGYSAMEYDSLEKMILVRQRHAHAWAMAYVAGRWLDIDTTPPDWSAIETARVSRLVRISDFFSFLGFRFSMWRQRVKLEEISIYFMLPLLVLMIIYVRRLLRNKRKARVAVTKDQARLPAHGPASTSEFEAIEEWLNRLGHQRPTWETYQQWFARLASSEPELMPQQEIRPVLDLHYRRRFGPGEFSQEDVDMLNAGVKAYLNRRQEWRA